MQTMTDWEEPLIAGEKYAGVIGPGVVKGAMKPAATKISKLYQEAMELAQKVRLNNPDRPELVAKETGGLAHAHPDVTSGSVFSLVPHGDVYLGRVKQIPESGVYAGDVYKSSGLAEHIPDVLSTKIYPQKGMRTGTGLHQPGGDKPGIYLHPNQLAYPEQAGPILAHELTHASANLTDPSGLYGGGTTSRIQSLANQSQLPEQWELAGKLRRGTTKSNFDPNQIPKALRITGEKDIPSIDAIMETIQLLRDKGFAGQYYKNLFGEGLARYVERFQNAPLSEVPPWLRPGWDAARRMKHTIHGRMAGAVSSDPTQSSLSNPGDLETVIHILNR